MSEINSVGGFDKELELKLISSEIYPSAFHVQFGTSMIKKILAYS